MTSLRYLTIGLLLLPMAGCSALINPDDGRLGSDPDGGGVPDASTDGGASDGGAIDGGGPMCPPSCDDDVECTTDVCQDGACVHTPDDGVCGDGQRCSAVLGCVAERCSSDLECSDGLFCTGEERCDPSAEGTGCVPGTPVECADSFGCTMDTCNEVTDACVFEPRSGECGDSVDCTMDVCDPARATDASGCVHTPDHGLCGGDFCTVDRVCDPSRGCVGGSPRNCDDGDPCNVEMCTGGACVSTPRDDDMDSYPAASASSSPGGPIVACGGNDCGDSDPAVHPMAMEICDGFIDHDCDGAVDEGCGPTLPDSCASAEAIALGATGSGSARGRFDRLTDDYQTNPVCRAPSGGRDAVYFVDLPRGIWDVTIDTTGSTADTVLGVGFACSAPGFQAVCNDDHQTGTTASRVWLHRVGSTLSTTRVFILVDAYSASTAGDYVVNVSRRSAAGDGCFSLSGTMDISGGGTVLGFQTEFAGSSRGSCQPRGDISPEATFRLTGPSTRVVDLDAYSTEFTPDLYLRAGRCGGTELECDAGASVGGGVAGASIRRTVTSGSTYYVFVDGGRSIYALYYQPF